MMNDNLLTARSDGGAISVADLRPKAEGASGLGHATVEASGLVSNFFSGAGQVFMTQSSEPVDVQPLHAPKRAAKMVGVNAVLGALDDVSFDEAVEAIGAINWRQTCRELGMESDTSDFATDDNAKLFSEALSGYESTQWSELAEFARQNSDFVAAALAARSLIAQVYGNYPVTLSIEEMPYGGRKWVWALVHVPSSVDGYAMTRRMDEAWAVVGNKTFANLLSVMHVYSD